LGGYASGGIGAFYWYSSQTINFKYDDGTATVAQFTQWLKDQYNVGHPVTLVYPLETATTESVQGQFLSKSPVTQTAGSISGLPIAITESEKTVPTPTQPLQINCNNGVVKVNRNLYSTEYHNKVLSQTDGVTATVVSGAKVNVSAMVNCTNVKSFMITSANPKGSFRLFKYRPDGTFIDAQTTAVPIGQVLTLPSDCGYFRIQYNYTSDSTDTENILIYNSAHNLGIYTDGTTETVEITGKNLVSSLEIGKFIRVGNASTESPLGSAVSASSLSCTGYIKVSPSTTYTSTIPRTANSSSAGLCYYGSNTVESAISGVSLNDQAGLTYTFTTPSNCNYVRFSWYNQDGNNAQLELGSTATTYEPYFDGGTATAENLFKIGDYKDEQEVLTGGVARNVGIMVLDGTEGWKQYSANNKIYTFADNTMSHPQNAQCLCSHFVTSSGIPAFENINKLFLHPTAARVYICFPSIVGDVDAFKQWLATQYNAGTPVIVVYPLDTAITESVTAQPMNIQAGTNIVQITQASMDDLELEVKYKAGVAVTITEVENAQLDDNVEVTING
jgi:hypothetical protein